MLWNVFVNFCWFALGLLIGAALVFADAIDNGVCKKSNKTGFEWIKPKSNIEGENNEV